MAKFVRKLLSCTLSVIYRAVYQDGDGVEDVEQAGRREIDVGDLRAPGANRVAECLFLKHRVAVTRSYRLDDCFSVSSYPSYTTCLGCMAPVVLRAHERGLKGTSEKTVAKPN